MPAFAKGAESYMDRNYECPYSESGEGVKVQAWDRGDGMRDALRHTAIPKGRLNKPRGPHECAKLFGAKRRSRPVRPLNQKEK